MVGEGGNCMKDLKLVCREIKVLNDFKIYFKNFSPCQRW